MKALIESLKKQSCTALLNEAAARFKNYGRFYEMGSEDGIVWVEVVWGDWKHDHSFVDRIFRTLGAYKYSEDVIAEDGSDAYSSVHRFILV